MKTEQKGNYTTIMVCGRTHILVENKSRDFEPSNYLGTGLALRGVCKKGQTFEQWAENRMILKK
jgi:hypothetical protein